MSPMCAQRTAAGTSATTPGSQQVPVSLLLFLCSAATLAAGTSATTPGSQQVPPLPPAGRAVAWGAATAAAAPQCKWIMLAARLVPLAACQKRFGLLLCHAVACLLARVGPQHATHCQPVLFLRLPCSGRRGRAHLPRLPPVLRAARPAMNRADSGAAAGAAGALSACVSPPVLPLINSLQAPAKRA
jgi:hypothetical protein